MAFEVKEFTNLGMDKDSVISKTEHTFAFDNYNIRLSASDDSTVLSVTNERGPKPLDISVTKKFKNNKITLYKDGFDIYIEAEYPIKSDIYIIYYVNGERHYGMMPAGKKWTNWQSGYENNDEYDINSSYVGNSPTDESDYIRDDYFVYFTNHAEIPEDNTTGPTDIKGIYAGHCIAGKYLVLFTHDNNDINYIYRLVVNSQKCKGELLYQGKLNIKHYNEIETLYYYESEDIQKVYWVDSINPPRVINIMAENNYNRLDTQFDFTPTVNSLPKVKIKKDYNGVGLFPSGTIQYFISYYNKHGAETGIVFSSALQYLSYEDRGAKADEVVTCSFDISISNIDTSFDYIRVYSAKRTSKSGPIELNIVADVQTSGGKVTVTDSNISQETVDPNILYFIGGTSFIAGTLTQKNDTLFMGDITLLDSDLDPEIKGIIKDALITEVDKFYDANSIKFVYKCFSGPIYESAYDHSQQLNYSSRMFKTFKRGEIYRFAIQFLSKTDKWTTPIWIGDKKCELYPEYDAVNNQIIVPDVEFKLPNYIQTLVNKDYVSYRILMAETNYNNRSILAQGVVCPTVFNYGERYKNGPFSISSWIMRPRGGNTAWEHFENIGGYVNREIQCLNSIYKPFMEDNSFDGAVTICVGLYNNHKIEIKVYSTKLVEDYSPSNMYEIAKGSSIIDSYSENNGNWKNCYELLRTVFIKLGLIPESFIDYDKFLSHTPKGNSASGVDKSFGGAWGVTQEGNSKSLFHFYIPNSDLDGVDLDVNVKQYDYFIDSSIVTFHSPEISDTQDMLANSNLDFRIVGIVPITASYSDAMLEMSSKGLSSSSGPRTKREIIPNFYGTPKTLTYGDFYADYAWTKEGKDFIYPSKDMKLYPVYMWQKEGSIIGQSPNTFDIDNGSSKPFDTVKAELKTKTFATQRYSFNTTYITPWNSGISRVSLFNSDELTLCHISGRNRDMYYQGNYDKLIVNEKGYDFKGGIFSGPSSAADITLYDPVRINYKSTPHAIFSLENAEGNYNILPKLKGEAVNSIIKMSLDGEDIDYPWDNINIDLQYKCLGIYYYDEENLNEIIDHINHQLSIDDGVGPYDLRDEISKYTVFALLVSHKNRIPTSYHRVLWTRLNREGKAEFYINKYVNGNGIAALANAYNINMIDFTTKNEESKLVKLPTAFKLNGNKIEWEYVSIYKEKTLDYENTNNYPYLYMAELYRNIPYNSLYGGTSDNAIERISWIPISDYTGLNMTAKQMEGDTYYQRWDCLKTYPFTEESTNKVVDITSFMVETHINLDGRCDVNRGNENLLNARPTNFGLINPSYTQDDNVFKYNVLDDKFDLSRFNNQVTWSLTKKPTEDVDSWTGITLNSSLYLDGSYGRITKLLNVNDNIVAFQEKGISTIQYNERVQISTESGAPVEIQNNNKVTGYNYVTNNYGCKNKFSIVPTKTGVYFVDELNKTFSKFSKDGIVDVSSQGMTSWFKNNDIQDLKSFYDGITHDIYLVDANTCLAYNEDLNRFTSFFDYEGSCFLFNNEGSSFIYNNKFYEMFKGDYGVGFNNSPMKYWIEYRVNPEPYIDKTFTNIEFIADILNPEDDINSPHTESLKDVPFNKLDVWNSYQKGSAALSRKLMGPLAKKFRIWRIQIPRDSNSKFKQDRIRSPWMHLRLSNSPINKKMVFHNLIVKYFK
jgi:hypothetical protein